VHYVLPILVFILLIGAGYALIGRRTTRREGAAVLLALVAALPLWDGGLVLAREYGRRDEGRVVAGVVVGKLSSTGEDGSRTIGTRRRWRASRGMPTVVTSNGFQFHDVLARLAMTGSTDAWFVEYRYPCSSSRPCWQREEVSHALWSDLRIGQTVNVHTAKGHDGSGRLDGNPPSNTAITKLGIGGTLALLAGFISGRMIRRRKYVTASAVVTSVEAIGGGGDDGHWRVGFAYLAPDGTACESADEVYVSGVHPGDQCTAVYPPDRPELGTLRLSERSSV
jgi:hypothetical protein